MQEVRGLGLLNALVIRSPDDLGHADEKHPEEAQTKQWNSASKLTWDICIRMAELGKIWIFSLKSIAVMCLSRCTGLLAKPTHGNIIRLAPPLVITDSQMDAALEIIHRSLQLK